MAELCARALRPGLRPRRLRRLGHRDEEAREDESQVEWMAAQVLADDCRGLDDHAGGFGLGAVAAAHLRLRPWAASRESRELPAEPQSRAGGPRFQRRQKP